MEVDSYLIENFEERVATWTNGKYDSDKAAVMHACIKVAYSWICTLHGPVRYKSKKALIQKIAALGMEVKSSGCYTTGQDWFYDGTAKRSRSVRLTFLRQGINNGGYIIKRLVLRISNICCHMRLISHAPFKIIKGEGLIRMGISGRWEYDINVHEARSELSNYEDTSCNRKFNKSNSISINFRGEDLFIPVQSTIEVSVSYYFGEDIDIIDFDKGRFYGDPIGWTGPEEISAIERRYLMTPPHCKKGGDCMGCMQMCLSRDLTRFRLIRRREDHLHRTIHMSDENKYSISVTSIMEGALISKRIKKWLKEQEQFWDNWWPIYDTLPKYIIDWYGYLEDKYGSNYDDEEAFEIFKASM